MTLQPRKLLVHLNAAFLIAASLGGLVVDVRGSFFGTGPEAALLNHAPGAGIGLIEAHGLAFIIAATIVAMGYDRRWHPVLLAIHVLLGTANLVFWQFFIASHALTMGYVTTIAHWLFVAGHLLALVTPSVTAGRAFR